MLRLKITDMAGKGEEKRNNGKINEMTFINLVEQCKHLKTPENVISDCSFIVHMTMSVSRSVCLSGSLQQFSDAEKDKNSIKSNQFEN